MADFEQYYVGIFTVLYMTAPALIDCVLMGWLGTIVANRVLRKKTSSNKTLTYKQVGLAALKWNIGYWLFANGLIVFGGMFGPNSIELFAKSLASFLWFILSIFYMGYKLKLPDGKPVGKLVGLAIMAPIVLFLIVRSVVLIVAVALTYD